MQVLTGVGCLMLQELENLAHESASEKRRELLGRLTGMFLDGAAVHSDREAALYADVVLQVLEELDLDSRAEYSESVADHDAVPVKVARRLADDDIKVAEPVLTRSPVFSDDDLIDIVSKSSQDHMRAISVRPSLSEIVTDQLIERGDETVVRTVSANDGARFSTNGLEELAHRSQKDAAIRSNLLRRTDIRQELTERVLPVISGDYAEMLRKMLQRADDQTIERVVDAANAEVKAGRSEASRQRLETRALLKQVQSGTKTIDEVLAYLAQQSRFGDVTMFLSRLSGVAENVISNVLFKTNNEPIAIICRALDASEIGYRAVLELRAKRLRLPQSHVDKGVRDYAGLSADMARRSLRFVKVRSAVA